MRDELNEFSGCVPGLALCDIGWNRNCRSSHLRYEAKLFFCWEPRGERVNELGEFNAFLPNDEVFVVLRFLFHDALSIKPHVTRHVSLVTAANLRSAR